MIPRGGHLQPKGLAFANGVAEIVPTQAYREYVSNFSRIPIRFVKGMNLGTLKPIDSAPIEHESEEGAHTLLADEGSPLKEGEDIGRTPLLAEVLGQVEEEREMF